MGCSQSRSFEEESTVLCSATEIDPRDMFGRKLSTDPEIAVLNAATVPATSIENAPTSGCARCTDIKHCKDKDLDRFDGKKQHVVITGESIDGDGQIVYHLDVPAGQVKKRFEDFRVLHSELKHLTLEEARDLALPNLHEQKTLEKIFNQGCTPYRIKQRQQLQAILDSAAAHPTTLTSNAYSQFIAVNL